MKIQNLLDILIHRSTDEVERETRRIASRTIALARTKYICVARVMCDRC
ncbi:hypothetical protein Glo7428_4999 (plasmid) [Gloeocapsa sp. PCC 7428]|nr:hypothetical protein Glo7428_4999 [Gloeocapsa sp. PCC 7428]